MVPSLYAQREYAVDATIDVVGGGDDNPRLGLSSFRSSSGDLIPFYAVYPAVNYSLRSSLSDMTVSYSFGWNRTESDPKFDSNSHTASMTLSRKLSPLWTLQLSDSFSLTNDFQTVFALRGIAPTAPGQPLNFIFEPVALNQDTWTNGASVSFEHSFSERDSISFGGRHSLRAYEVNNLGLSDQQGIDADVSYTRRLAERTSWNLGYSGSYFAFNDFNNAVSNVVRTGMSHQLSMNTALSWSLGGSHVRNVSSTDRSLAYEASASVQQVVLSNLFVLSARQDQRPSGLAGLSKNRTAGLGFSRSLGSVVSIFANGSAFESKGILGDSVTLRGYSATANIGFNISKNLSFQIGGQYQEYTKPAPYAFTQRRVFASLRYRQPNLFHSR